EREGDATLRGGDPSQEVDRPRDQPIPPDRLVVELVEHPEGDLDVDRLTVRAALVRLQRVAEPTVRVLVGLNGRDDRRGGGAEEEAGEAPPIEEAGAAPDEVGRTLENRGRGRHGVRLRVSLLARRRRKQYRRRAAFVLHESDVGIG